MVDGEGLGDPTGAGAGVEHGRPIREIEAVEDGRTP